MANTWDPFESPAGKKRLALMFEQYASERVRKALELSVPNVLGAEGRIEQLLKTVMDQ